MCCKKCEKDKYIVNKHFGLCQECNNERLHGSKYGKQYKFTTKNRTSVKRTPNNRSQPTNKKKSKPKKSLFATGPGINEKKVDKIKLDEDFYELCFNNSDHKCEECGEQLPDVFRDENGKVVARWRYSHVVPKSIASSLRHELININHLCLKHHAEWETGNNEHMKIYKKNAKNLPNYF